MTCTRALRAPLRTGSLDMLQIKTRPRGNINSTLTRLSAVIAFLRRALRRLNKKVPADAPSTGGDSARGTESTAGMGEEASGSRFARASSRCAAKNGEFKRVESRDGRANTSANSSAREQSNSKPNFGVVETVRRGAIASRCRLKNRKNHRPSSMPRDITYNQRESRRATLILAVLIRRRC